MQVLPVTGAKFTVQGEKTRSVGHHSYTESISTRKARVDEDCSSRHDLLTNGEPKPQLRICIKNYLVRLPVLHAQTAVAHTRLQDRVVCVSFFICSWELYCIQVSMVITYTRSVRHS